MKAHNKNLTRLMTRTTFKTLSRIISAITLQKTTKNNILACCCFIKIALFRGNFSFGIILKSVNLQYNTLGRLDDGTNKSSTKRLMFQVHIIFFHDFLQNSLQKSFQFIFFYKITKIKIKSFL